MISTWILIVMLNGSGSATPAHAIIIPDMPDKLECQRVGQVIDSRFNVKQALCVEIKKART